MLDADKHPSQVGKRACLLSPWRQGPEAGSQARDRHPPFSVQKTFHSRAERVACFSGSLLVHHIAGL